MDCARYTRDHCITRSPGIRRLLRPRRPNELRARHRRTSTSPAPNTPATLCESRLGRKTPSSFFAHSPFSGRCSRHCQIQIANPRYPSGAIQTQCQLSPPGPVYFLRIIGDEVDRRQFPITRSCTRNRESISATAQKFFPDSCEGIPAMERLYPSPVHGSHRKKELPGTDKADFYVRRLRHVRARLHSSPRKRNLHGPLALLPTSIVTASPLRRLRRRHDGRTYSQLNARARPPAPAAPR